MSIDDDNTDLEASILEREAELDKLEKEEDQDDNDGDDDADQDDDDGGEGEKAADDEDEEGGEQGDDEEEQKDENPAKARVDKRREESRIEELERENRELRAAQARPQQAQTQAKEEEKLTPQTAKNFEEFKQAKGFDAKEPNKAEDYEAWLEWKSNVSDMRDEWHEERMSRMERSNEQTQKEQQSAEDFNQAVDEFLVFEKQWKSKNEDKADDYTAAAQHLKAALAQEILQNNPNIGPSELNRQVGQRIIGKAGMYYNMGLDPAAALYHEAYNHHGYQPKVKEGGEGKSEEERKISAADNLKTIAKNKKQSGSPLGKGGKSSSSRVTKEDYDQMTLAEKMNLSNEEMAQIEADLVE